MPWALIINTLADVLDSVYSLSRLSTGHITLLLGANLQKDFNCKQEAAKKEINICRTEALEGVLSRNESRNIVGCEP